MTTNGIGSGSFTVPFERGGLSRVDAILVTARRDRYREIMRRDPFPVALAGIDAGCSPDKICVVLRNGLCGMLFPPEPMSRVGG